MKTSISVLSLVLLVQIIASILLSSSQDELTAFQPNEPLLGLSLSDLSQIDITIREKSEDRSLLLAKKDGQWILPDYFQFPVAQNKLEVFSKTLFQMNKPYPVGSTEEAAKQFKITEKNFETKVEFKNGENILETLYLGTSPAYKRVHARVGNNMISYAIDFSGYALRGKDKTWIDREYLKIPQDNVQKITFHDFTILRDKETGSFTLGDLQQETEQVLSKVVGSFVNNITQPSFIDILGTEAKKEYNLENPALSYVVTLQDGSEKTFAYGEVKDESHYILQVSDTPQYFKVAGYQVDKFKDVVRAKLVAPSEKKPAHNTKEVLKEEAPQ